MNKKSLSILILIISFLISGAIGLDNFFSNKQAVEGLKDIFLPSPTPTHINQREFSATVSAHVIKVVDGDTIHVLINQQKEIVRIIGIDTPETVDPRKPVQCFGEAASDRAKRMLLNQDVILESDPTQSDRDKYDRLLRYVWLKNKQIDYGLSTIEQGFAHEYTYDQVYKYQSLYKKAELDAQNQLQGLWAENACLTPTLPIEQNSGND